MDKPATDIVAFAGTSVKATGGKEPQVADDDLVLFWPWDGPGSECLKVARASPQRTKLSCTAWRNLVMPVSVGMRALLLGVAKRNDWPTALVSIALNLAECLRLLKLNFIPSIPHDLDEYLNYITAYNPVQIKEGAQTGNPYNSHEGLLLVALFFLTRQKASACTLFQQISKRKNEVQGKLNSFLRS